MKKHLLQLLYTGLFAGISLSSQAQIQWASTVEDYSSQSGKQQYTSGQALGPPNSLPQGGNTPTAWKPQGHDHEHIRVNFKIPQKAGKITIVESFNAGAVSEVEAFDERGSVCFFQRIEAADVPGGIRVLEVAVPESTAPIKSIRLSLDGKGREHSIDAIGIGDAASTYVPKVNTINGMLFARAAVKMPASVNSTYDELNPIITPDGNTMYFSRRNSPKNLGGVQDHEDIYFSTMNARGEWNEAKNFGAPLNNEEPNFVCSVSPDGNRLLLGNIYGKMGSETSGASYSVRTDEGWSRPEAVRFIKFKNLNERVDYFMGNSNKVMIISETRRSVMDNRDLYVSFLAEENLWTEPINLGPDLNTYADEYAPYLAADERTLYFASAGFPGYGRSDIFVSHRTGDSWTQWSVPENLGPVVNTELEDAYFSVTAAGNTAYFSSARSGKDLDIYFINMPIPAAGPVALLKGKVLDKETDKPLSSVARIKYENLSTGEETGFAQTTPKTGAFTIALPAGTNYGFYAEAPGYIAVSGNLDLTGLTAFSEQNQDIFMVPVKKGAVITLNNIFFDYNKATLKKESFPELKRTAAYLRNNPKTVIEIGGHTDSVGSNEFNQTLSLSRANTVRDYLISLKADPARMTAAGFGKTEQAAANATAKGRALNRRVVFKILEN